jgi:hypothetical protein
VAQAEEEVHASDPTRASKHLTEAGEEEAPKQAVDEAAAIMKEANGTTGNWIKGKRLYSMRQKDSQRHPQSQGQRRPSQMPTQRKEKCVLSAHRLSNTPPSRLATTAPATFALCDYEHYTRRRRAHIVGPNRTM